MEWSRFPSFTNPPLPFSLSQTSFVYTLLSRRLPPCRTPALALPSTLSASLWTPGFNSMATTFGGSSDRFLSPSEKEEFYNKMRAVVVVVQTKLRENNMIEEGTGFVINKYGYVLTCCHNIPKDYESIAMRRFDEGFKPAKLVTRRHGCDLAMIKPVDVYDDYEYCKLADDQALNFGMEVLTISHGASLFFSFDSGYVAYGFNGDAADRRIRDGLAPNIKVNSEFLGSYDGDNPVLQICGLSGSPGSSGSPLFDCTGAVVGMCSFKTLFTACRQVPVMFAIGFPIMMDFVSKVLSGKTQEVVEAVAAQGFGAGHDQAQN